MKRDVAKKIPTARSRREMLGYISATVAAVLLGCERRQSDFANIARVSPQAETKTGTRVAPSCVVRPEQTEGPYFVDERVHRADISSDPSSGLGKVVVQLRGRLRVSQIGGI